MAVAVLARAGRYRAPDLHRQSAGLIGRYVTDEAGSFLFFGGDLVCQYGNDVALFVEAHGQTAHLVLIRTEDERLVGLFAGDRQQVGDHARALKLGEDLLERHSKCLKLLFFHPEQGGIRLSADHQPEPSLTWLANRLSHNTDNIVELTALQWRYFFPDIQRLPAMDSMHSYSNRILYCFNAAC